MASEKYSNPEDLEVISKVLQGDQKSFRILVEKYYPMIFRLCRSYLSNQEEAEDAVQEIFLRGYKSLNSFKLDKQFNNWLYTIAMNHLKSRYSKILKFQNSKDRLQREPVRPPTTPYLEFEREEVRSEIADAISGLPVKLKQVVVLYYIEELSAKRIATILDLTEENVKSRLFRARKKLKQKLQNIAT